MKIFEKDGKINFVDENNVVLGYDLNQSCCENADWFIADSAQEYTTRRDGDNNSNLDGFVFDRSYFKEVENTRELDAGKMVIFRIVKYAAEKFIHLYNSHNGYYGHGFDCKINDEVIRNGCL